MFKRERDLAERSRNQLKRNEVRSLRSELDVQWKAPAVQELFEGKPSFTSTRLASRTIIYSTGKEYTSSYLIRFTLFTDASYYSRGA